MADAQPSSLTSLSAPSRRGSTSMPGPGVGLGEESKSENSQSLKTLSDKLEALTSLVTNLVDSGRFATGATKPPLGNASILASRLPAPPRATRPPAAAALSSSSALPVESPTDVIEREVAQLEDNFPLVEEVKAAAPITARPKFAPVVVARLKNKTTQEWVDGRDWRDQRSYHEAIQLGMVFDALIDEGIDIQHSLACDILCARLCGLVEWDKTQNLSILTTMQHSPSHESLLTPELLARYLREASVMQRLTQAHGGGGGGRGGGRGGRGRGGRGRGGGGGGFNRDNLSYNSTNSNSSSYSNNSKKSGAGPQGGAAQ